MHNEHKMKIFACRSSKALAERIAKSLNMDLGQSDVLTFSDGEFQPSFNESVRGATVFIVQSTFPPVENLFELLLMIDAAKRASAHSVVAVMPYFGWARQDRKDKPRVSIGAKLVANILHAAGCDRVMTCDLHADQIQGFFDFPVDHIYASSIFLPYLREKNIEIIILLVDLRSFTYRSNHVAIEDDGVIPYRVSALRIDFDKSQDILLPTPGIRESKHHVHFPIIRPYRARINPATCFFEHIQLEFSPYVF